MDIDTVANLVIGALIIVGGGGAAAICAFGMNEQHKKCPVCTGGGRIARYSPGPVSYFCECNGTSHYHHEPFLVNAPSYRCPNCRGTGKRPPTAAIPSGVVSSGRHRSTPASR